MRWSKYSTPQLTARLPVLRVCAIFEGLTRVFCFVLRFGFCASLLDFTLRFERLHVCYYYADVWSVLAYFCSEYSCSRPLEGRSGQVIDSVCMSVFVARLALHQLFVLNRGTLCTGALLTTDKLSAVSYDPLSHSRHNAGDRSRKVGHEIRLYILWTVSGRQSQGRPIPVFYCVSVVI